jgi:hypothetical protein
MHVPEERNPSPTAQVLDETMRLLAQSDAVNEQTVLQLTALAKAGRLSKAKDVMAVLATQGDDDEDPTT